MNTFTKFCFVASTVCTGAAAAYLAVKKSFKCGYEKGRLEEMKSLATMFDKTAHDLSAIALTCNRLTHDVDSLDSDYYSLETRIEELEKFSHELSIVRNLKAK